MHPAEATWRDHGFFGGRLRGVFPIWPVSYRAHSAGNGVNSNNNNLNLLGWTCPLPLQSYPTIVMGHGAGGRMMADLIEHLFAPAFDNEWLGQMGDSATIELSSLFESQSSNKIAFTTDSFVVSPLFFPGGNIGELAVYGTINDLAMRGAKPLLLSASYILEEGLPMETLGNIVTAMAQACRRTGVKIATGDTKVVQKGHGDGVYINTSGIGVIPSGVEIGPANARPGDALLVSGTIGDHGIAVMSVREGLTFQTEIQSDSSPLNGMVDAMIAVGPIHCLRDATRGGLAAVLNELADVSKVGIEFDERKVPLRPEVSAACEMLGLDPFYVANEGKLVAIVPGESVEQILAAMHKHEYGRNAALIGSVVEDHPGLVTAKTSIGGMRVVDVPAGELLPRIC
jgi:hydrogenase expression/formation protein HypE